MGDRVLWVVGRYPNGEWGTGGTKDDPDYEGCEMFEVEASSRDEAKRKAQAQRKNKRAAEQRKSLNI